MIPEKQKAYKTAFDRACREFRTCTLEEQVKKSKTLLRESGAHQVIEVPFFDETIELSLPEFEFMSLKRRNVSLSSKILIIHYLTKAGGFPLSAEKLSYEDIPGCRPYLPVFERRVCRPLLVAFRDNRDALRDAGIALLGTEEEFGNASFTLSALPMVPITFILWEGDYEFSPSIKVLFDRTIDNYLPLEDITVISKLAANRIIHAARLQALE